MTESGVEAQIKLEKAVEEGSKLQIVKVSEDKVAELKKEDASLKAVFDINVVSKTGEIIKIDDNKMQIRMLLDESLRGYSNYQVVYIKDGKIAEKMPTKIDGNYIVFETTHLSEYGILANNEKANGTPSPKTGDHTMMLYALLALAVSGLAGSVIGSKKNIIK